MTPTSTKLPSKMPDMTMKHLRVLTFITVIQALMAFTGIG
jgi:hypothetical protein